MQPVVYSLKEGVWKRSGDDVCFYKYVKLKLQL